MGTSGDIPHETDGRGFSWRDHVAMLVLGSPVLAAAASVGIAASASWLKERGSRIPAEDDVLFSVLIANGLLAGIGSTAGGALTRGEAAVRVAVAVAAALTGLFVYFVGVVTLSLLVYLVTGLEPFTSARR